MNELNISNAIRVLATVNVMFCVSAHVPFLQFQREKAQNLSKYFQFTVFDLFRAFKGAFYYLVTIHFPKSFTWRP